MTQDFCRRLIDWARLTGGLVSAEHADAARGHGIPLGGVKVDMRRPTVPSKFEVWRGQEERRCG